MILPPWFPERWFAAAIVPRYAGIFVQAAGWRTRRQAREDYNLYAVISGGIEIRHGGGVIRLGPGGMALIPPGHPFADGDHGGQGTTMLSAGFALAAGGPDPLASLGLPAAAVLADAGLLEQRCRSLAALGVARGFRDPAARMEARGWLDHLLSTWIAAGFAAGAFPHAATGQAPAWLWRVIDHHEAYLARRPSLADLASVAGLSPAHFSRRFSALMGCPPRTWMQGSRLARARALLMAEAGLPVKDIAVLAGFGDAFQFSRIFRKANGMPPEHWRRAHLPTGEATT